MTPSNQFGRTWDEQPDVIDQWVALVVVSQFKMKVPSMLDGVIRQILIIWSPWMLVLGKSIGRLMSLAPAMREKIPLGNPVLVNGLLYTASGWSTEDGSGSMRLRVMY